MSMSSAEGNATAQSSWSLLPNDILIRILQARFAEAACADIDEEQDLAVVAAIRACCKAWHASVSGLVTSISAQRLPDGCLKRPLANAFPALACLDFSRMSSLQDADCARLMHAPLRMLTELSINATNLSLHGLGHLSSLERLNTVALVNVRVPHVLPLVLNTCTALTALRVQGSACALLPATWPSKQPITAAVHGCKIWGDPEPEHPGLNSPIVYANAGAIMQMNTGIAAPPAPPPPPTPLTPAGTLPPPHILVAATHAAAAPSPAAQVPAATAAVVGLGGAKRTSSQLGHSSQSILISPPPPPPPGLPLPPPPLFPGVTRASVAATAPATAAATLNVNATAGPPPSVAIANHHQERSPAHQPYGSAGQQSMGSIVPGQQAVASQTHGSASSTIPASYPPTPARPDAPPNPAGLEISSVSEAAEHVKPRLLLYAAPLLTLEVYGCVVPSGLEGLCMLSSLRSLALDMCAAVPVPKLAAGLTSLTRLVIKGPSCIHRTWNTHGGLASLSQLTCLDELALVDPALTRGDLGELCTALPALPSLTSLSFRQPNWQAAEGQASAMQDSYSPLVSLLHALPNQGKSLKVLDLLDASGSNAGLTGDQGLHQVAAAAPCLTRLQLGRMAGEALSDVGVSALAGLTGLQSLDISGCPRLSRAALSTLAPLQHLTLLDASNVLNATDTALAAGIGSMRALRVMRLRGCWKVTGEAFQVLASCLPMLTELDVSECKITDSGLAHIGRLPSLQKLVLTGCWDITSAGLSALAAPILSTLDNITIAGIISDRSSNDSNSSSSNSSSDGGYGSTHQASSKVGVRGRYAAESLRHLNLTSTATNDAGLIALAAGLHGLVSLEVCRASSVGFKGIEALSTLTGLTSLKLNRCPGVTDACVPHLMTLTRLTELHLRHCRALSNDAVLQLASSLKQLDAFELEGCWAVSMDTINALYRLHGQEHLTGGPGNGKRGCRVQVATHAMLH